jgi:hypothetical protein
MKQKKHLKNLIKALVFLLLVVLLLWGITRLMQPKYYFASQLKTPETELWNEFYALPKNDVEVLFLGASSVYCGVDAPEVGALTGRKVYTMASSSARMYDLYYMFQEALRFQTPETVVLDMGCIRFETYGFDRIYKRTYDDMRWSSVKLEALSGRNAHLEKKEPLINRFITLLDFHSRWNELTEVDFFPWKYKTIERGFVPCEDVGRNLRHDQYETVEEAVPDEATLAYFGRIVDTCAEKGIRLILVKVPSISWHVSWSEEASRIAARYGLLYTDYNDEMNYPRIGITDETDWRDDIHLNKYGAKKFAKVLSEDLMGILKEEK